MQPIDVFADFSGLTRGQPLDAALAALDALVLDGIGGRVYCATSARASGGSPLARSDWRMLTGAPVEVCNRAMSAAAADQRPLLVLLGYVQPGVDAVGVLLEALADDPMVGFAVPRVSRSGDGRLATIDDAGDRAIGELPRRLLAELAPTYLVADAPACCLLIKPEILGNFAELDGRFRTAAGALWHYIGRARRCGFRTVVCNRAVVAAAAPDRRFESSTIALRQLPQADRVLLEELLPDVARAHAEFGTRPAARAETRLARALPQLYGAPPSLLLDVRNIGRAINGTSMAALGILRGLYELASGWQVALVARKEASALHRLETVFSGWPVYDAVPDRQFTVALRLSQPWQIDELIELHAAAAFNVYLFLDTISWDVVYPAPRSLDGTWRFMADHADALMFNSAFTRARLCRRFPAAASIPSFVAHHSFDPSEYTRPDVGRPSGGDPFLFVIGNGYDHKDVAETIEMLARAFPYQRIVALGPAPAPTPRVTVLESGTVSDLDLHRLYAWASAVVFPSFYEGFGFPVVTTLAYGQTVVARRSALVDEIAAQCPPRGRLVTFDRREELVELIGRLVREQEVPEEPLGTALRNRAPKSWRDVAAGIVAFVEELSGDLSRSRWRSRDHTIQQLLAARGEAFARAERAGG